MKIMTYNILEGGAGRVDPLAEVIRLSGANVVIVQEAWEEAAFHKLADRVGMDRFWAGNPRNNEGAVGLLSQWEIREAVNHAALDQRLTRGAFHAVVRDRSKKELGVIGVHLHAGKTVEAEQVRLSELPAVFEMARAFAGMSHVLAGDLNASHPGQRTDPPRPREVVRNILERGYVDAHALHHAEEAFDVSFPTSKPVLRVDYVFVTPELSPKVKGCDVFKPEMGRFASDHFPVVAELEL